MTRDEQEAELRKQGVIDVLAELRKHADDEVRLRAADEIEQLRGVIRRNCILTRGQSPGDRAIIELLMLKRGKR